MKRALVFLSLLGMACSMVGGSDAEARNCCRRVRTRCCRGNYVYAGCQTGCQAQYGAPAGTVDPGTADPQAAPAPVPPENAPAPQAAPAPRT